MTMGLARIDMENLTDEFSEGSAHAAWWGVLHGQMVGDLERAEYHVKVVEAEVGIELRRSYMRAGEKFTVDSIKDEVTLHARVREAHDALAKMMEKEAEGRAYARSIDRKDAKIDSISKSVGREILANTPVRDALGDDVRRRRGEIESAPSSKRPRRQSV